MIIIISTFLLFTGIYLFTINQTLFGILSVILSIVLVYKKALVIVLGLFYVSSTRKLNKKVTKEKFIEAHEKMGSFVDNMWRT